MHKCTTTIYLHLPENDVTGSSHVLSSILLHNPAWTWLQSPRHLAVCHYLLEIPLLGLEHIGLAVSTERHHHFCAGLKDTNIKIQISKLLHILAKHSYVRNPIQLSLS